MPEVLAEPKMSHTKKNTTVVIDEKMYKELQQAAALDDRKVPNYVQHWLSLHLAEKDNETE